MRDLDMDVDAKLHCYAIFNGTAESKPLADFYRLGGNDALPLWRGTPYSNWHEVMPLSPTFLNCKTSLIGQKEKPVKIGECWLQVHFQSLIFSITFEV